MMALITDCNVLRCLAGTTITSAMDCTRKAWLTEVVGGSGSPAALQGTLLHEVVQGALQAAATTGKPPDEEALQELVRRVFVWHLDAQ